MHLFPNWYSVQKQVILLIIYIHTNTEGDTLHLLICHFFLLKSGSILPAKETLSIKHTIDGNEEVGPF